MSRQKNPPPLILVAGPTASGKSALALELARARRGAIINADAMQIYAGAPVLTAQPDAAAREEIPHALYGTVDPARRSSAGIWRTMAADAIRRAVAQGYVPILVGGTGLYFKALLEGLADIPDIPASVREDARRLFDALGEEKFRARLAALDPASAARLARNDRQRLIRAMEVVLHTGKPIGAWQDSAAKAAPSLAALGVRGLEEHLVMPAREDVYAACDSRFGRMLAEGAIEEARALLMRGLDPSLPAMKIIGVREIGCFLRGDLSLEDAADAARQATRNYAKRQMTWFRHQWARTITAARR